MYSAQVKGTHVIYFSTSFHNVNQIPMLPRTTFHCETQGMNVLLGESRQCIYVITDGTLIPCKYLNRVYFYCKTKLRLIFSDI